jgi:uncharacterized repeat protein (TIGR04042 family)
MPEVYLKIAWPGEKQDRVYSPSTVINQYFKTGDKLTVTKFEEKVDQALKKASQRVYERFGFECTSAMGELDRIKAITGAISNKESIITIL